MAKFSKKNFYMIMDKIQEMEAEDQNIWIPIGILEILYEDNSGWIDYFFHSDPQDRNIEWLWNKLNSKKVMEE